MPSRRKLSAMALVPLLSGCIPGVAGIVIEAERERLLDLERFELEVASRDCVGLTDLHASMEEDRDNLTDLDQRNELVRDAMIRDDCNLPPGLE